MEDKFIEGAQNTLKKCSPRLFIEANSEKERALQEELLKKIGYEPTGRVWNASPTFEWKKVRG